MEAWGAYAGQTALLAVLLTLSAMFSAAETALFSLTPPEIHRWRLRRNFAALAVVSLHGDLRRLLLTLLFGNMTVNILFFAVSTLLGSAIGRAHGPGAAVLFGLITLFALILFGETLPKQLALVARATVARLTAIPIFAIHRVLARPLDRLGGMIRVAERAVGVSGHPPAVRAEELRLLMEFSRAEGVLSAGEHELIDGVIDLPSVRMIDIMTPRVDLPAVDWDQPAAAALELARATGRAELAVRDPGRDELVGWLDARDVYAAGGEGDVKAFAKAPRYVSEFDRADQVLSLFRKNSPGLAIVVDERGQAVGGVNPVDILSEVSGEISVDGTTPEEPIREEGGEYRLAGGASVREWRDFFGVVGDLPPSATVGGLVTSLLGRAARVGDRVTWRNLEMTVAKVERRRIAEIRLRLLPEEE